MSSIYLAKLTKQSDNDTTVIKNIMVANKEIVFRFQWAVASEEQYAIVLQYINTKTKSDPLNRDGTYTYEYDYLDYYLALEDMTDEELNEWLDTGPALPNGIKIAPRPSQLLMIHRRIEECQALRPVVNQYKEIVKWQFHAIYNGQTTVGYIEPGGWYRNQDPELCFRFISDLPYIGKNDFNNVSIEFEVNDA